MRIETLWYFMPLSGLIKHKSVCIIAVCQIRATAHIWNYKLKASSTSWTCDQYLTAFIGLKLIYMFFFYQTTADYTKLWYSYYAILQNKAIFKYNGHLQKHENQNFLRSN